MIFNKFAKTISWGLKDGLQQMVLEQLDSPLKKNKVGPLSHTVCKNYSK